MDPASAAKLFEALYAAAIEKRHVTHVYLAMQALLCYDYFLTLPLEIKYMWKDGKQFNMIKFAYFFTRYFGFVSTTTTLFYQIPPVPITPRQCDIVFWTEATFTYVNSVVAEVILYVRFYAFSGRNDWIRKYLLFQYLTVVAASAVLLSLYLKTTYYITSPAPHLFECFPAIDDAKPSFLIGTFSVICLNEILLMGIMIWMGYQKYRGSNSRLVTIFFLDGVSYFFLLAAVSLTNVILLLTGSTGYMYLLTEPQSVLHTILACRMVLNLRKENDKRNQSQFPDLNLSAVRFAPRPMETVGSSTGFGTLSGTTVTQTEEGYELKSRW